MKMSRERKWLCGILGLGVGALVLDQTLLGTPESANAQEGTEIVDSSATDSAVTPDELEAVADQTPEGATDLSDFAARLDAASSLTPSEPAARDAFALPGDWQIRTMGGSPDGLPNEDVGDEVQAFLDSHILVGTIESASGNYAILEGSAVMREGRRVPLNVRVGYVVNGFKLMSVEDRGTKWMSIESGNWTDLSVTLPENR